MKVDGLTFGGFYYSTHYEIVESFVTDYFDGSIVIDEVDINYEALYKEYLDQLFEAFDSWLLDEYHIHLEIKCIGMYSPRAYNFSTDTAEIECKDKLSLLYRLLIRDENYVSYIKETTTSYDGYMAFYNFEDYSKCFSKWDEVQKRTLLDYMLMLFLEEWEYEVDLYGTEFYTKNS